MRVLEARTIETRHSVPTLNRPHPKRRKEPGQAPIRCRCTLTPATSRWHGLPARPLRHSSTPRAPRGRARGRRPRQTTKTSHAESRDGGMPLSGPQARGGALWPWAADGTDCTLPCTAEWSPEEIRHPPDPPAWSLPIQSPMRRAERETALQGRRPPSFSASSAALSLPCVLARPISPRKSPTAKTAQFDTCPRQSGTLTER
ncbi:unnamed protein product [Ixodes persulcatus]